MRRAVVSVRDPRRRAVEIMQRDIGDLEEQLAAALKPRGDQVLDDLLLAVDRHVAAGQLRDRDVLRPPLDAVMLQALARALAGADRVEQVDGVLLE